MARRAIAAAAALMVTLPMLAQAATEPVFGYWFSENRRAIIQITPCGESACGRMVWLREPMDESGTPKLDVRGNPLCGIRLVEGLRRSDAGTWSDGSIYNPRDGKQYSASLRVVDGDRLEVRGYVGLPVFGKSQVWTRAPGDRGGC